jgi:hypothetical protein
MPLTRRHASRRACRQTLPRAGRARRLFAALAWSALACAAGPSRAAEPEAVRLAVVGFTGDLSAAALTELSQSVRASLTRQAPKEVLAVVSREEMALVYQQRGAPCRPDDVPCVVEASGAWNGRLFVRGVVRTTSEGIIIGATLESVRGILVAAAQTPAATDRDIGTAVPVLVRELLDGEKAYRERIAVAPAAREGAAREGATREEAARAPLPPGRCNAVALVRSPDGGGAIPGEIHVEDGGLRFESTAAAATQLHWGKPWERLTKVEQSQAAGSPTIAFEAQARDNLVLSFANRAERDACFAVIAARRSHKAR